MSIHTGCDFPSLAIWFPTCRSSIMAFTCRTWELRRSVISQKNELSTFNVKLLKRPCEMIPFYDDGGDNGDDIHSFIHSFIPLACAECYDSFVFSGVASIPVCYIPFPSTLSYQLVFHPPSLHFVIYFLVHLLASCFQIHI